MRSESKFPYKNQILVCTHTRADGRRSCGREGLGEAIFDKLKSAAKQRGLHGPGQLRVTKSSCLGLCARGPNVIVQPCGQWFSQVVPEDAPKILDQLAHNKDQSTE